MLIKLKQGTPFNRLRAELKNFEVDYDDDVECTRTHPKLLPEGDREPGSKASPKPSRVKAQGVISMGMASARLVCSSLSQPSNCRSVARFNFKQVLAANESCIGTHPFFFIFLVPHWMFCQCQCLQFNESGKVIGDCDVFRPMLKIQHLGIHQSK